MPRLKTIRAFDEVWKVDEANWTELFRLIVEERLRLRDACVAMKVPYTLVYAFLNDGGAWQKRYEAALEAVADDLVHEALEIADEQAEVVKEDGSKFDPDVPRDKLRVETRFRTASKWGKGRYGDKETAGAGGMTVIVDRSCGGRVEITAGGATARIPLGNSAEALAGPVEIHDQET